VGKRVDASSAEMARLTAIVERQQERNDRASVDELERGVKLREFEARFSGLENLRAMVSGLAKNVTDLAPAIQAVLDLRGELRDDNGDPIDVQAMAAQLALVRTLAEHLNGIDGTPVRMRDVELRLRELTDALGLPGGIGLEGRIAQHATQLVVSLNEQFEGLSGDLKSEQQAALNDLSINQDAVLNDLRANQDAALTATLNDLRANQDATLNDLSINQEAVLNDLRDNQHAALDQLRFEIDARFAESAGRLQEEMKAALLSEVGDLRQQMEKQAQQLRELDERLRRLEG